jgi:hypothetical protein
LLTFVIAALIFGISQILAATGRTAGFWQIIICCAIGIAWAAYTNAKRPDNMGGCMMLLALVAVPLFVFFMAGVNWIALRPEADIIVGWAGGYRLPALMFIVVFLFALVTIGYRKLKRIKRKQFSDFAIVTVTASIFGTLAGLAGFIWLAVAFALRKLGL